MNKSGRAFVTMICVLCVTAAAFLLVLLNPAPKPPQPSGPTGMPDNLALPEHDSLRFLNNAIPGKGLALYTENADGCVEIGSYMDIIVERDGVVQSYHDVTYRIVEGRDCAAMYFDGSLLGLGEGELVIKAFLDDDPSVYGFCRAKVVAGGASRYTELMPSVEGMPAGDAAFETAIAEFPDSYKPYLRALHLLHPNWEFRAFHTGLDFFESVYQESIYDKNLTLIDNMGDLIKSKAPGDYDQKTHIYVLKDTGWVAVNPLPVAQYMDPRNFLDERTVFQFELLSYDENVHTLAGVEGILKGSFMGDAKADYRDRDGNIVAADRTYAEIILEAGRTTDVNPYYLAAKIRQEIGATPSNAANGVCPGYEGYYNFYNIGATDGEGNIERGLAWASEGTTYNRPWTSPEKSILGGAEFLVQGYVAAGQYTGYLQKFNVNKDSPYGLYSHQYMTNVSGAVSQAVSAYNGYADIGILDEVIIFSIPVYDNMPDNSATTISLGGSAIGLVNHSAWLREGPGAFFNRVEGGKLPKGAAVTVVQSVKPAARYYQSRLFYPCWYEVRWTGADGTERTGFVSEEYIDRAVSEILPKDGTLQLRATGDSGSDVIRYYSDNRAVATVDQNGVVTAHAAGVVNIIAYTAGGAIDCLRITVTDF